MSHKYNAFISYSHAADGRLAPAIQSALQRFAKPWYRLRALRLFRDKTGLGVTPALWPDIEAALKESEYFILLASPQAATSKWVQDEVDWWLDKHSVNKLLIVLTDGKIAWDRSTSDFDWARSTALPRNLRNAFAQVPGYGDLSHVRTAEHLSLRNPDFRDAMADLAATLHRRSKDELIGEDVRQHRRTRRLAWSAGMALVLLTLTSIVAAFVATKAKNLAEARRQEADKQRRIAVSRQLAAQAINHLDDQLDLALLLSVEACRADDTVESRSALLTALQHRPYLGAFLSAHDSVVRSVAFSPDGKSLASGGWDGRIILWDTATRQRLGPPVCEREFGNVNGVIFSPDGKTLAAACDQKIVLWDLATRQPLGPPLTDTNAAGFYAAAFSPDGRTLVSADTATGTHRPTMVVWDLASRKPNGKPIIGYAFAFSPDGRKLAFGSDDDNSVLIVEMATRRVAKPFTGHKAQVRCMAFSPDGLLLASGSEDGAIILWDVATGRSLGEEVERHKTSVNSLAFSPNGKILASGSGDKTIILWNLKTGQPIGQPLAASEPVYQVAFSVDGETLVSCGGNDRRISLWDLTWHHLLSRGIEGLEVKDSDVAFSPDGKLLAAADSSTVVVLDVASGERVGAPFNGRGRVTGLAFSPDGRSLASSRMNGTVVLWDAPSRKPRGPELVADKSPHRHPIWSVAFSPDSKVLASGGDSELMLWDVATHQPVCDPLTNHMDQLWGLAFSSDGKLLASCGSLDRGIVLWDMASHQPKGARLLPPFSGRNEWVSKVGIAFSPDSRILASTSPDNSVLLWDVATRKLTGTPLVGHKYPVYSLAFSPDGRLLATGSADNSVILWDVATHQPLGRRFEGHTNNVCSVAFSRDGKNLASSGEDNRIFLRDVSFDSWRSRACSLANRNLTQDEWQRYLGDEPYRNTSPELSRPGEQ